MYPDFVEEEDSRDPLGRNIKIDQALRLAILAAVQAPELLQSGHTTSRTPH